MKLKPVYITLFLGLFLHTRLNAQRFLQLPVEGKVNSDFTIVNYVDWSANGILDTYCGSKTYDGHEGTDFVLFSFKQMDSGVNVLAADSGIVTFILDTIFDREKVSDTTKGLGNYIALKHLNGYYTYYGHLKKFSALVNLGDTVSAGQRIAQVGSSGNSSDPHLHFELWYDSLYVVDPFAGNCGRDSSLWLHTPFYDSSLTVWQSGLYEQQLNLNLLRERDSAAHCCPYSISRSSDTLNYWAQLSGLRKGDTLTIKWIDSANSAQFSHDFIMQKDCWYYYFWSYVYPSNLYSGKWKVSLLRNQLSIDSLLFDITSVVSTPRTIKNGNKKCPALNHLFESERFKEITYYRSNGQEIKASDFLNKKKHRMATPEIYFVKVAYENYTCSYKVLK
jgi:murein DD-endopeptidase MepM/ murein hydrolase activator NlpD